MPDYWSPVTWGSLHLMLCSCSCGLWIVRKVTLISFLLHGISFLPEESNISIWLEHCQEAEWSELSTQPTLCGSIYFTEHDLIVSSGLSLTLLNFLRKNPSLFTAGAQSLDLVHAGQLLLHQWGNKLSPGTVTNVRSILSKLSSWYPCLRVHRAQVPASSLSLYIELIGIKIHYFYFSWLIMDTFSLFLISKSQWSVKPTWGIQSGMASFRFQFQMMMRIGSVWKGLHS